MLDNEIIAVPVYEHYRVYLDIETYNEKEYHIVPMVDNTKSHVGMIALIIEKW